MNYINLGCSGRGESRQINVPSHASLLNLKIFTCLDMMANQQVLNLIIC